MTAAAYQPARTHPLGLAGWLERDPDGEMIRSRVDGAWRGRSRMDVVSEIGRLSTVLTESGIDPGDRVAIIGVASPGWYAAALAAQAAGAVTVGAYPSSSTAQLAYILRHSEARVVFVGNSMIAANLQRALDELPHVQRLIALAPEAVIDELPQMRSAAALCAEVAMGDSEAAAYFARRAHALDPDDLSTIVYTSGTTGDPRGALHSYRTIGQIATTVGPAMGYRPDDDYIVHLPLNHTAEYTYTIVLGSQVGWRMTFADSPATLPHDLVDARPTVMFGVPRIFEKVRDDLNRRPPDESGHPLRPFGLDRLRVAVCGGAPLARDLVAFFERYGLQMYNTYGMTEAGAIACAWDRKPNPDTCGIPFPGVSIRIADDGECLVDSPGLCLGYYKDEAATAELFTPDGYLRTGDIVEMTAAGEVRVVDRKKDLIITSGGKNIAPSAIEHALNRCPFVHQAIVVGNGRKFVSAIVELAEDEVRKQHPEADSLAAMMATPAVVKVIDEAVAAVNDTLSGPEQVKKWAFLPGHVSPGDPEVTPTMKIRRGPFEKRYRELIDSLYA